MKIDVKINSLQLGEGNVKASAAILLDDCIEIRNVKVMNGKNGLFASMPSYLATDGKYYEICAPLNKDVRTEISNAVVAAYRQTISQMQGGSQAQPQNNYSQNPNGGNYTQPGQNYESAPTGNNYGYSEQPYGAAPAMSM